jgi:hypothetical protein
MVRGAEGTFAPSEEVAQVDWLSPSEAVRILDHPAEREVVARAFLGWTPVLPSERSEP